MLPQSVHRAMESEVDALHFLNAPGHGAAILGEVKGYVASLYRNLDDDPLLAAYQIRDQLPKLYASLHQLNQWCYAVIEASPDDLPSSGARLPITAMRVNQ